MLSLSASFDDKDTKNYPKSFVVAMEFGTGPINPAGHYVVAG
jgi:hypothetical protein